MRGKDGMWHAVWQVNDKAPTFAATSSTDLVTWRPQDYPRMTTGPCLEPTILAIGDVFSVYYKTGSEVRRVGVDAEFRHFGFDANTNVAPKIARDSVTVDGKKMGGQIFSLKPEEYSKLKNFHAKTKQDAETWKETLYDDEKNLLPKLPKEATATLKVTTEKKNISDKLIGIFFEDISYAADGGLYAEMVQNRDFEYNGEGKVAKGAAPWGPTTAWHSSAEIKIETTDHLSATNAHHVILGKDSLINEGWDGMGVKKDAEYIFSLYTRCIDCRSKKLAVRLMDGADIIGAAEVEVSGNKWTQTETTIKVTQNSRSARLAIIPSGRGEIAADIISLFPKDTYKGRRNGMRKDLAEAIAALHPRFVRFPGGCMSHGQGIDNIFHWRETVGPIPERTPAKNIWHYHQTRGLGFYEYFVWCEDMGAEPLPVLAAGVPCQNSAADATGMAGQQGGIPMKEMPAYCQEFLDLIEWANGDPATSELAKLRADAGHPAPFNLKYIGVGNEDLISTAFEDRMLMIAKAIKAKYPDITICGTAGPFHDPSSDYIEGWKFAKEHKDIIGMIDEHYYEMPGWFLNNQDYYDNYDRTAPKVYLGEYSVQARPRRSDLEAALCEAIHICSLERNGDVVAMSSYAPLLCNTRHSNWSPDMIYFKGAESPTLTPSYYTQMLFGQTPGTVYTTSKLEADEIVSHRVGTSIVSDPSTGKTYLRIVNALPVALKIKIDGLSLKEATFVGFGGKPQDRSVEIENGKAEEDADGKISIPAYSIRIYTL